MQQRKMFPYKNRCRLKQIPALLPLLYGCLVITGLTKACNIFALVSSSLQCSGNPKDCVNLQPLYKMRIWRLSKLKIPISVQHCICLIWIISVVSAYYFKFNRFPEYWSIKDKRMILTIFTTNVYIVGQIIQEGFINYSTNKRFVKHRAIYTSYDAFEAQ